MDDTLIRLLDLVLLALALWGLVDVATRKQEAFPAAGRLTKPVWLAILGASALVAVFVGAFGLLGSAAFVGTIVYLGDVRPAVRELRSGGW